MRVAGSVALIAAGLALAAGAAWPRSHEGARLYVEPKPVVWSLWFNPESPLFRDNPDLIRAINYALDRPALVRAWGRYAGKPTARLIPPELAGYGARSPYPVDGPDLDEARALGQRNLRGGTALLGVYYGSPLVRVADEVKRELTTIGMNVDVRVITRACSGPKGLQCPRYDIMFDGWGSDYPDPSSMLARFVSDYYVPALTARWSDRLAKANRLAGESRARAFAQLDYDVMREAPPLAPFMAANAAFLVSVRTHCVHWNLYYGVDLNALCVR